MLNLFRAFLREPAGVSAIEFSMASPVLAVVLLGVQSGWTTLNQVSDMRTAVKAGANYVLKGGTDLDAAKDVVKSTWTNAPSEKSVNVVKQCTCGTQVAVCTQLCIADSSVPQMSYIITASRSIEPPLFGLLGSNYTVTEEETVRVR